MEKEWERGRGGVWSLCWVRVLLEKGFSFEDSEARA